ncbi:MAG: dTMP kinase [Pseudomonadota bacterium]
MGSTMNGKLIIFEGVDGGGTTTQANLLRNALLDLDLPVHVTEEPSQGPVGNLIRQILHGRLISVTPTGMGPPSWGVMALLFAADRLDHVESEILLNLRDGINVISDRYVYSSVVYQTVTSGDDANEEWITTLNKYAPPADLIFYLDVDAREAHRRRLARRIGHELYEDSDLQEKIAEKYKKIMNRIKAGRVVMVDGNASVAKVHETCLAEVRPLLGL